MMRTLNSNQLRNGIFPAISLNKGCHRHQQLQPSNASPEGTQEGKKACRLAAIRQQPLPMVSPGNSGFENTGYWPQITEVHIKGMISVNPDSFFSLDLSNYTLLRMTENHYEQDFYHSSIICELSEDISYVKFAF